MSIFVFVRDKNSGKQESKTKIESSTFISYVFVNFFFSYLYYKHQQYNKIHI